ncbi:MAG: gliding motility protein GldL [Bacteroidetes bacterium]|nr:gliding motility protein GldL [Bacteroidota bacterium]
MANFTESKSFKKFMGLAYGYGASVVIIGALFKILHWPGADIMLIIGLGTEAFLFALSAYEPAKKEWDWSLVYPEFAGMDPVEKQNNKKGTVTQQLDKMLEEAKVGPELINSLGAGLKSLSANVNEMANLSHTTVATSEFTQNIQKASKSIENVSTVSENISQSLNSFSGGLTNLVDNLSSTGEQAGEFKSNLSKLNTNISNLNNIYGNMLSAMTGSNSSR